MDALGALWHILNFFAAPVGLGILSATMAKALWRRDLRRVRWSQLAAWTCGASAAACIAGLVITGHDGKMSTYAAMVVAAAAGLWWAERRG